MAPKKKDDKGAGYSVEMRFGRTKANLNMGVVGLPNVGKSSFFNLLTKQTAEAGNFPFCTIDPNHGRCRVPDARFDKLCELWKPKSIVPAYLNITDIAGLVKGAADGAGLGNAFLSHIQAVDGIFHMVRLFDSDEVTHVDESVDPVRDLFTITAELCIKDMAYVTKIWDGIDSECRRANKKLPDHVKPCFDKVKEHLEKNQILSKQEWTPIQVELINEKMPLLITVKPVIYLLNMSAKQYVTKKSKWLAKVHAWITEHGGGAIIPMSVEFEERLWDAREDPEQLKAIKEEGANTESALGKLTTLGFKELNLLYFFTCGEDEVKCWTIYKGATAPNAAGAIHGDMERCFIKAEVCTYDDFFKHNENAHKVSMAGVKAAGKYRSEGKQYIIQDGDIINIMHNAKK